MSLEPDVCVLVVDDCEPLRFLKRMFLREAGFQVIQAGTGADALQAMETALPSLVLLDVNLPDIHGADVCRLMKARSGVPVVFTSSVAIPEEAAQMGDGCLVSLDQDDIVAAVYNALRLPPKVIAENGGEKPAVCRKTLFAPALRLSLEGVRAQADVFESGSAREALDASAAFTLVLNRCRQIVFCNQAAMRLIGATDHREVLGLRPGEALRCVNVGNGPDGCGTSEFCRTCGAVRAILEAGGGNPSAKECRITRVVNGVEEALDLIVAASLCRGDMLQCTLHDISSEKRRLALEHVFFHDVLNTAGAVQALADELGREAVNGQSEMASLLVQCAAQLQSEIRSQQLLLEAETNHLAVTPSPVSVADAVTTVVTQYRGHPVGNQRSIRIASLPENLTIVTDPVLLNRVLGNMVKNALEAIRPGETVTVGGNALENGVEFCVHNPGVIRRELQLQIFQRSFSTKGRGRGLGTYSMKLLSERYLGGTVGYASDVAQGTTFFARYPTQIAGQQVS